VFILSLYGTWLAGGVARLRLPLACTCGSPLNEDSSSPVKPSPEKSLARGGVFLWRGFVAKLLDKI
jgi:hypothetical protein